MGEWLTLMVPSTTREPLKPPPCRNLFASPSSASLSVFTGDGDDGKVSPHLMLAYDLCHLEIDHCRSLFPGRIRRWSVSPNPDGPVFEESSESEEKDSALPEIGSIPSRPELYKHTWAQKRMGRRSGRLPAEGTTWHGGKGQGIPGAEVRQLWSVESRGRGVWDQCREEPDLSLRSGLLVFFFSAVEVLLRKVSYPTHVAE